MDWIVPPECQGQIVEVSYASSCDGFYWRKTEDKSNRTVSYARANASDCGCFGECHCFEPWNSEPMAFDWKEDMSEPFES
jgi:hypothetical protein